MSKTVFIGRTYNIELNENNQFVLIHPVGEDKTYDSFDELAEENPVCEEARSFFFGGSDVSEIKYVIYRQGWNQYLDEGDCLQSNKDVAKTFTYEEAYERCESLNSEIGGDDFVAIRID